MPQEFSIEIERDGDCMVVAIAGELDLRTRDQLTEVVVRSFGEARTVTADLSRVTFVDSSGLSAFVHARKEATRLGCEFRIRSATGPVARVLQVTGLGPWLTGD